LQREKGGRLAENDAVRETTLEYSIREENKMSFPKLPPGWTGSIDFGRITWTEFQGNLSLCHPQKGNLTFLIDRRIFPEVTLTDFIYRAFVAIERNET
jgi:hypothetical protein